MYCVRIGVFVCAMLASVAQAASPKGPSVAGKAWLESCLPKEECKAFPSVEFALVAHNQGASLVLDYYEIPVSYERHFSFEPARGDYYMHAGSSNGFEIGLDQGAFRNAFQVLVNRGSANHRHEMNSAIRTVLRCFTPVSDCDLFDERGDSRRLTDKSVFKFSAAEYTYALSFLIFAYSGAGKSTVSMIKIADFDTGARVRMVFEFADAELR